MPTKQTIERTVSINAPAGQVYEKLRTLDFFNRFSVWGRRDSSVVNTITGTDGTIGAVSSWNGDPQMSGRGTVKITALEPGRKVEQQIEFIEPKKGKAESIFTLREKNGATVVTWSFVMTTPRPWNIFNLFFKLDKQVGPDFEEGLNTLKKMIEGTEEEKEEGSPVRLLDFPATKYAIIKQKVNWADITDFYNKHWELLSVEFQGQLITPGTRTGLIFDWNEKDRTAELGAAIPVPDGISFDNPVIAIETIPDSKAIYIDHTGPGDRAMENFPALRKYIGENDLREEGPRVIQFGSGADSSRTRIIFLVD